MAENKQLDNINSNIEYLIDYLQNKPEDDYSEISEYLQRVEKNTITVNGILENISELKVDTSLYERMIEGLDTIASTIEATNINIDVNIKDIKTNLEAELSDININFALDNLERIKSEISGLEIQIDVDDVMNNIAEIKNSFNSIKMDIIVNDNLDAPNEKIDIIIDKLNNINSKEIDLNIKSNIETIISEIKDIKDIEINVKLLDDISSFIDNMDTSIDFNTNIKEIVDIINSSISQISTIDKTINIIPNMNLEVIDEVFSKEYDITPNINMDELADFKLPELDLKVNPIIEIKDIVIEPTVSKELETINNIDISMDDTNMVKRMDENNKLLKDLINIINNLQDKETEKTIENNDNSSNSVMNITQKQQTPKIDNQAIIATLKEGFSSVVKAVKTKPDFSGMDF